MRRRSPRSRAPYWFLLPFFLAFGLFWVGPTVASVLYSFTSWDAIGTPQFVGLGNYARLWRDDIFWVALRNTFMYVILYNSIMIPLAIAIGVVLNSALVRRWGKAFRLIYFAPVTVSLAVVALIFDLLLNREFGLVNSLISALGLSIRPDWLHSAQLAPFSIILMRLWRATGYYAAFIIAGLQSIPGELYEAARVDGAGELETIWHVALPLLRPVILFVVVMSSIWSFQLFDEPWILLQGGPGTATLTVLQYLYQNTFLFSKVGYGAAISYVLTVIMIGVSLLQFRFLER